MKIKQLIDKTNPLQMLWAVIGIAAFIGSCIHPNHILSVGICAVMFLISSNESLTRE